MMRVAVAKYAIGAPRTFAEFADKQTQWLSEARRSGAQLAVLPEYLSLELGATFGAATQGDLHASLVATQAYHGAWLDFSACWRANWGCISSPAVSCSIQDTVGTAIAVTRSRPRAVACGRTSCNSPVSKNRPG